jgi:hypothetical protein
MNNNNHTSLITQSTAANNTKKSTLINNQYLSSNVLNKQSHTRKHSQTASVLQPQQISSLSDVESAVNSSNVNVNITNKK